ncbi:hypothetical protein NQZ68_024807 [Dissostichus eleginoides]|nr:hypothetical protein NQZ68_024807 [Dissostichus eleginoides]
MCGESAASWPSSLYLADNLFPVDYEYQMMKFMVEVLGQPKDHMLRAGIYTKYFFIEEVATHHSTWRLMGNHPEEEVAEVEDRMAFVDFLKQLLHLDGDQRISPHYALQQSFITKSHLTEPFDSRDRAGFLREKYLHDPVKEIQIPGLLMEQTQQSSLLQPQSPLVRVKKV